MFTIPEVFTLLEYPRDKRHTWRAGSLARKAYVAETGQLPEKNLRRKTNPKSKGSHCLAEYPDNWLERIKEVVHSVVRPDLAQHERHS